MNTDPDCIFCKIVANEIPSMRVFEDESTVAFMDINPAADGHVLVIPRSHSRNLFEIPVEELATTAAAAKRIACAIRQVLNPDGISIIQANDKGAAQSVFHFHFHVLPRTLGDELKINWGPKPGDLNRIETNAEFIRKQIRLN